MPLGEFQEDLHLDESVPISPNGVKGHFEGGSRYI
jgi:hypothetical protein